MKTAQCVNIYLCTDYNVPQDYLINPYVREKVRNCETKLFIGKGPAPYFIPTYVTLL